MENTSHLAPVNVDTLPIIPTSGGLKRYAFEPQTYAESLQLAKLISQSDIVPKQLRGKEGNIFILLTMAAELNIPWVFMLQNVFFVNDRVSMYGDLPLAVVRRSGKLKSIKEWFEGDEFNDDKDKTLKNVSDSYTAVCEMWREGSEKPSIARFSVAQAKSASLWGKQGPWVQYWGRMLVFRARGFLIRDLFSDVTSGVSIGEEQSDIEQMKTVTEANPVAKTNGQQSRTEAVLSKMQTAQPITIEQAPAEEITGEMVLHQAKRRGLDEDALRALIQATAGTNKLTKANIQQVIEAINELPIPMMTEEELAKLAGNVPMVDMRSLALVAQKCGLTGSELVAEIVSMVGSVPLTSESYRIVIGNLDARVAVTAQ